MKCPLCGSKINDEKYDGCIRTLAAMNPYEPRMIFNTKSGKFEMNIDAVKKK